MFDYDFPKVSIVKHRNGNVLFSGTIFQCKKWLKDQNRNVKSLCKIH